MKLIRTLPIVSALLNLISASPPGWEDIGVGPRDVDAKDGGNPGHDTARKKLVNESPYGEPYVDIGPAGSENQNQKRTMAINPLEHGAIDLAIPVPAGAPPGPSPHSPTPAPYPTTLLTIATTTSGRSHLGAVTIDDTISLVPSTTYPVHRTLETATLANGTEIRIEQTENQTHDVHVEETEREKGAEEEDKVVVHVRVFVEHVRDKVAQIVKRAVGEGPAGEKDVLGGGGDEGGNVVGKRGETGWGCHWTWLGYACGYHPDEEEHSKIPPQEKKGEVVSKSKSKRAEAGLGCKWTWIGYACGWIHEEDVDED